jgi:hypothetical protein
MEGHALGTYRDGARLRPGSWGEPGLLAGVQRRFADV